MYIMYILNMLKFPISVAATLPKMHDHEPILAEQVRLYSLCLSKLIAYIYKISLQ